MKRGRALLAVLAFASAAQPARAEGEVPACGSERPWVKLSDAAFTGAAQTRLASQLRAALRARGIDVCDANGPASAAPPLALVVVTAPEHHAVDVTVEVRDAITAKRVARDIPLATMPEDGRPLTVALAADELLRASWAELAVKDAPPVAREVPPEVTRLVPTAEATPRQASGAFVGVAAAGEHHGGGLDLLGADALLGYWAWPRVGFEARAGLRSGLSHTGPDGEVRASALVIAAGPLLSLVREGRFGADLGVHGAVSRVSFMGVPYAGGGTRDEAGVALHVTGAARGWFHVVPTLALTAEAGLGAPLRWVSAVDGSQTVTSLSGVRLSTALGLVGVL